MLASLQPGYDRIARSALLGVQFRDAVDGRVVAEGLRVELQDLWQPRRRQALAANRSGIFALHSFAGMAGFDTEPQASPPAPGRFRLTARDASGRYLPVTLSPDVPSLGLWSPATVWASPPELSPHVPLFSAATRALPVGMACLRAELRAARRPEQATPWARLELWLNGTRIAEGVADEAGRAMVVFPLPRPREATLRTSLAGRPSAFEWTVTLRAFWSAAHVAATVPDFADIAGQSEVALLQATAPDVPLPALTLRAGETLLAARLPSSFVYVAE